MVKVPCHKCEDRIVGCHSVCERYISYKKELAKQNELIEKGRHMDQLRFSYEIERANRVKALGRRRKNKEI